MKFFFIYSFWLLICLYFLMSNKTFYYYYYYDYLSIMTTYQACKCEMKCFTVILKLFNSATMHKSTTPFYAKFI